MPEAGQIEVGQARAIRSGADYGVRLAARFLDLCYTFIVHYVIDIAIIRNLETFPNAQVASPLSIAGTLAYILYATCCEGFCGATVGKRLFGLHVVSQDGSRCRIRNAIVRNLAYYVDSLLFGLIAYISMSKSPLRQRLGDRWGRTVVVRRYQIPRKSQRSLRDLVLALVLATSMYLLVVVWASVA